MVCLKLKTAYIQLCTAGIILISLQYKHATVDLIPHLLLMHYIGH